MGLSQDSSVNRKYVWGVLEVETITFEWISTADNKKIQCFLLHPVVLLKVLETLNPL